jgi:uncharacterized protein (DUF433 family)/DNA-binding transcriptional MerR regulator
MDTRNLLGVGIYSVPEAARLTGVTSDAIRRWLWGYRYRSHGEARSEAAPLWHPQIPVIDHVKSLGFRDLIEIQFVDHFKKSGLSLQSIRGIIERATDLVETSYPLSTVKFRTDGRRVIAEMLDESERRLIFDLRTGQYLFSFFWDKLYDALEYSSYEELLRWWPLGKDRRVLVDPKRNFGQPITPEGIPTHVLAKARRAEGEDARVADWYRVDIQSVRDAAEFERQLQAA